MHVNTVYFSCTVTTCPLYRSIYRLDAEAKGSMVFRIPKTYIKPEDDSLRVLRSLKVF